MHRLNRNEIFCGKMVSSGGFPVGFGFVGSVAVWNFPRGGIPAFGLCVFGMYSWLLPGSAWVPGQTVADTFLVYHNLCAVAWLHCRSRHSLIPFWFFLVFSSFFGSD